MQYKNVVERTLKYYQLRGYSKTEMKNKVYNNWVDQTNTPYREQPHWLKLIYKVIDTL